MSASLGTLVLLAGLALAAPAGAAAAGEDSRGLWQINVEAAKAPQQVNGEQRGDTAKLGSEPASAGSEPGGAHVAISLGDGRI